MTHTPTSELGMNYSRIRQSNQRSKVHTQAPLLPTQWLYKWVVRGMSPPGLELKPFVVEAWHFPGKAKMLVSQNRTTRNYVNSMLTQLTKSRT